MQFCRDGDRNQTIPKRLASVEPPGVQPELAVSVATTETGIKSQFSYLKREPLEQYSEQTGVPLYRLHSVASFFPHFQLTPPKPVTLKICRDMACHVPGSGQTLRDLQHSLGNGAGMIHV